VIFLFDSLAPLRKGIDVLCCFLYYRKEIEERKVGVAFGEMRLAGIINNNGALLRHYYKCLHNGIILIVICFGCENM
jgi:hypothetical protein